MIANPPKRLAGDERHIRRDGNINIKDGITKQNVESPSGNYDGYASVSWILKE